MVMVEHHPVTNSSSNGGGFYGCGAEKFEEIFFTVDLTSAYKSSEEHSVSRCSQSSCKKDNYILGRRDDYVDSY
jgi:hypothetical protein